MVARCMRKTVVVASGAAYRRPPIANLPMFEGAGVSYWASPVEAKLCEGEEVALVGGGNSAGQAVVFLAPKVKRLHLVVRREAKDWKRRCRTISSSASARCPMSSCTPTRKSSDSRVTRQLDSPARGSAIGAAEPSTPAQCVTFSCFAAPIQMPRGSMVRARATDNEVLRAAAAEHNAPAGKGAVLPLAADPYTGRRCLDRPEWTADESAPAGRA